MTSSLNNAVLLLFLLSNSWYTPMGERTTKWRHISIVQLCQGSEMYVDCIYFWHKRSNFRNPEPCNSPSYWPHYWLQSVTLVCSSDVTRCSQWGACSADEYSRRRCKMAESLGVVRRVLALSTGPSRIMALCIIFIITIITIRYGCLLSHAISPRHFSRTSSDPHRSRFKLHTAALSVLCVLFRV